MGNTHRRNSTSTSTKKEEKRTLTVGAHGNGSGSDDGDDPSVDDVRALLAMLFVDAPRDLLDIISRYYPHYWDPRVYLTTSSKLHIFATAGDVYLAKRGATSDTEVTADVNATNIITLYARPVTVPKGYTTGTHSYHHGHIEPHTKIRWREEFYFTTQPIKEATASAAAASPSLVRAPSVDDSGADGAATIPALVPQPCLYLERCRRISDETVNDAPHHACRFSLGLVTTPTQSWICDRDPMDVAAASQPVPLGQIIGLRPIGTSTNPTSPAYRDTHRRWLTLRAYDASSVVVAWYGGDEHVILRDATRTH